MAVLNDFEANGYGVTALDEHHVVVLNDVPATEKVSVSQYQHCPAIWGCCSQASSIHAISRAESGPSDVVLR